MINKLAMNLIDYDPMAVAHVNANKKMSFFARMKCTFLAVSIR